MASLRTPLEVALGVRLPLDFSDLDQGDHDLLDAQADAYEADLLEAATEAGEFLYREAVREAIPALGRGRR